MFDSLRRSDEYQALLRTSRRLGRDPLQVQGPGGNTSLKQGGAMWIKASGTWLAHAEDREIMVACDVGLLRLALSDDAAEQPVGACVASEDLNPHGLRPSIETAVHAALDWPVVLHTHCVATIAMAIRTDGAERIAAALNEYPVAFIPYVKPGWDLAKAIRAVVSPNTRIVILGNHGLVVCGETVAAAEDLLRRVSLRLEPAALRGPVEPSKTLAKRLKGTAWRAAPDPVTHAVAMDPARLKIALGATLYPDHLIFLGPGCVAVNDRAELDAVATGDVSRKVLLLPGEGVAVPKDANPAVLSLVQCLGDVLDRVGEGADLNRLTTEQEAALLDWDAEKYRQSLNAAP